MITFSYEDLLVLIIVILFIGVVMGVSLVRR